MKKLTTAALAGLVAVAATANASVARWDGFGGIGAAFIADVQDIWTLPGAVVGYKNALYTELGGGSYSSDVWGGAHFELGPGVLAVWGNRPYSEGGTWQWFGGWHGGVPNYGGVGDQPNESVDIIYGFNLSDATALAVGVQRLSFGRQYKEKQTGTDYQEDSSANVLGLTLGWEQKDLGPIGLLEVGLQYSMVSGLDEYNDKLAGEDDKYSISGSDIDLRIGGDLPGEEGRFGRFELGFTMDGATGKNEDAPSAPNFAEQKWSGMGYNIGYGAGKSSDAGLGLVGIVLAGRTDTQEGTNEDGAGLNAKRTNGVYTLAAGFAGEGKVSSWLTVRGGLSVNVLHNVSRENSHDSGAYVDNQSTTDYGNWFDAYGGQNGTASFGTSLTFGNLTIDGVLDQSLLWTGPYFVTGSSSGLNTEVSATWSY